MWSRFKSLDPILFIAPILLMVVSVLFIATLTVDQNGYTLVIKQGIGAVIAIVVMGVASAVDYRALYAWRHWLYLAMLGLLILVRLIGTTTFGATSWIDLGFTQFQPSEPAKVLIIITVAGALRARGKLVRWLPFFGGVALALIPIVLVLMQPDFGTALILSFVSVGVLLAARLRIGQRILVIGTVSLAILAIVLSFQNVQPFDGLLKTYQKNRLTSFVDPAADPAGSGYNVLQSKIAVGSGGFAGRGLGFGSQSQLNFLPVVHADFIFAAIAEAWGLIGSYGLLACFAILLLRIIGAARHAQDEFGYLICIGVAVMFMFQLLVNVGMNMGIMPVTGIPLPFLSYGGTALVSYGLAIGIVQSVVVRSKRLTF